jgi:hypothetical protein
MLELLKDLWAFLKVRKKFWMAPIVIVLLLLGALIVLSQGSAVAPFIYPVLCILISRPPPRRMAAHVRRGGPVSTSWRRATSCASRMLRNHCA